MYISLGLLYCSSSDELSTGVIEPNCDRLIHSTCNIRNTSCQHHLFELTICARGDHSGVFPETVTIEQDELKEVLNDELESESPDSEGQSAWDKGFQILELLPDQESTQEALYEELSNELIGFYSSNTQMLIVIDSGEPMNSFEMNITLTHEFAHALQDQTVGLDDFLDKIAVSSDSIIAGKALTEGEAIHVMWVASALLNQIPPQDFVWHEYYTDLFENLTEEILTSDSPLISSMLLLPYVLGGRYVTNAWLDGGPEEVASLYEQPILTTVQWMMDYGSSPISLETITCDLPNAPENAHLISADRLGAVGVFSLLTKYSQDKILAWDLAKQWRGGKIGVYGDEDVSDHPTFIAWRTVWINEEAAADFETALLESDFVSPERLLQRDGKEVLITASDQSAELEKWMGANTECNSPPNEESYPILPNGMIQRYLQIHSEL